MHAIRLILFLQEILFSLIEAKIFYENGSEK